MNGGRWAQPWSGSSFQPAKTHRKSPMTETKSDLIDRYLQAVKFWLPKAQQQDILAELSEDLHSQIEEREAALGHPLDEADLAAVLKRRGSPMRVASGFVPEQ